MHPGSLEKITEILEQRLGIAVPAADTNLFESRALDSLSFVNLLFYLESEFGLRISFDTLDFEELGSVNAIYHFVSNHAGNDNRSQLDVSRKAR